MTNTPNGVCSECDGPMWVGADSAPPHRRRCRKCQKVRPKASTRPERDVDACVICGGDFSRPYRTQACSRSCGGVLAAWRRLRPGLPFDHEEMAVIRATRKMRRTVRSRKRHLRRAQTWDGITDLEIWERDGWRCQIPECQYRSRKINRRYKYPDPRSPGIDHIVPLSLSGDDTCTNKRAAHHGCNMARGNRVGQEQLLLVGSLREPPLRTEIAGTIRERRKPKPPKPPKPKVPKPPKVRECVRCGQQFPSRQAGRGDRCRACLTELAQQALVMRQDGHQWEEIMRELGFTSPGGLYSLVVKYAGPPPPAWRRHAA